MTQILDKLDRFSDSMDRLGGSMDKVLKLLELIPRFAELGGVMYFSGKASERFGGRFEHGALGGAVVDGLAHSRLMQNQVGGITLAAYLTSIGLANLVPEDFVMETKTDVAEVTQASFENLVNTFLKLGRGRV